LFEVLVIDNGSTDNTKDVSLSFRKNIQNLCYYFCIDPGLMAARHMGCDRAKGELICYLDDDSVVDKHWLLGISKCFSDKNVVIAGGPCIAKYESDPPYWIEYFWEKTEYGKVNTFLSLIDFGNRELFIHPAYVYGCNFSIRKKIFYELGGTHPDYFPDKYKHFQGDGESGLSEKIYALGYKTLYHPQVKIHHLIPESRLTIDYFCWRSYFNGIHSSYIAIRKEHGVDKQIRSNVIANKKELHLFLKGIRYMKRRLIKVKGILTPPEPRRVKINREKIKNSNQDGFRFHQEAVKKDPKLLEWVLQKNYLGEHGKLPE